MSANIAGLRAIHQFKEEEIRALGGLSADDRGIPGIEEMCDLASVAVPKFREAVNRGSGVKQWWEAARYGSRRLRESNSETALGFLLRKGVQTVANDWYQTTPAVYSAYSFTNSSTAIAEWYAPLYPTTIADRVQRGTRFPEARLVGEDSVLVNQKFGLIVAVERELFDDDQTGQIRQRAQVLGQSMSVTKSVWASSRFIGAQRTYANVTVPASGYTTTDINGTAVTTPFSSTLYGSSLGNRPATYVTLAMGRLKQAYQTLMNAVDPLQNKIVVNPNCLLVSTQDAINAKLLTAEGYYPAVVGQSDAAVASAPVLGGTVSAAGANQGVLAGYPGGIMSLNPFGGLGWKVTVERYLTDWAWALLESGKGFVHQQRAPLEIVQEGVNTGSYFTFDVIQWRSRERFEFDWVAGGSRFAYLGNDGTVTGTL